MKQVVDALLQSPLHAAVLRASARYTRSHGPPPSSLAACTGILLLAEGLQGSLLSKSLPLVAPVVRESLEQSEPLRTDMSAAWEQLMLIARTDLCSCDC